MACRTNSPTLAHKDLLKRILRYLSGTKKWGIPFGAGESTVVGYSDADYANDIETRRSTTGLVIMFAHGPLVYRTMRQNNVTLSSPEAELNALCDQSFLRACMLS